MRTVNGAARYRSLFETAANGIVDLAGTYSQASDVNDAGHEAEARGDLRRDGIRVRPAPHPQEGGADEEEDGEPGDAGQREPRPEGLPPPPYGAVRLRHPP